MRLLLVAAMLLVSLTASAERAADFSYVRGARTQDGRFDEIPGDRIPARPSLFVHLGYDGPQGMPRFTLADGTPIPPTLVTELQGSETGQNLYRVDFTLEKGEIQVWFGTDVEPAATYVIDPSFVPRTRSVAVRPSGSSLWVDSDAVAYRIIGPGHQVPIEVSDGPHVFVTEGMWQQVNALYSNGIEETIYDGQPTAYIDELVPPLPDRQPVPRSHFHVVNVLLAWLALGLFAIVRRRRIHAHSA